LSYTVFYLNPGATEEVAQIIREQMPPGWKLMTPKAEGDYAEGLAACDFILVADRAVTAENIKAAPKLRMIQHQGVGYERIDLEACRARRIPVALTPEGTSIGVAEHTILLILAVYKHIVESSTGVSQGRWMQWELRNKSFEIFGKTIGLVGMGRIGREVAQRLLAFGANVIYFDPLVEQPTDLNVKRVEELESLLRTSDVVSLHMPLTENNRNLINSSTLRLMKPQALLVNTSRGGLVDEEALAEALKQGTIAGAALDVLKKEPPDETNPLRHMDNVLITPHISAGTRDALIAKMRSAFANMMRHTRNEPLANVVKELQDLVN
jgi:phosphoglycerate dehydrogenase-like enzyme